MLTRAATQPLLYHRGYKFLMNSSMLSFLHGLGATISDGDNCILPNEPSALDGFGQQNIMVPLSHCGLLEVRGLEAEKFLQGQITCSAVDVAPTLSSPGAYCTVKGRVVTSFQLLRPQSDLFWLRMRGDLLEIAARTFSKYIVFSKAKLAIDESVIGIGLHGATIDSALRELIGTLPTQQNGAVGYAGGVLWQGDSAGKQFEYWGPADAAAKLWAHCAPHAVAAGSRYWRRLHIHAGNAEVCAATSEMFLPHMLNYHETGAINFKKGCYTGQEIVARTHYRGQVKRHLLRAELNGPPPVAGSDISNNSGKLVGNVVDSVAINADSTELLAVVADESLDTQALLRAGTAELRTSAPLYAIP